MRESEDILTPTCIGKGVQGKLSIRPQRAEPLGAFSNLQPPDLRILRSTFKKKNEPRQRSSFSATANPRNDPHGPLHCVNKSPLCSSILEMHDQSAGSQWQATLRVHDRRSRPVQGTHARLICSSHSSLQVAIIGWHIGMSG